MFVFAEYSREYEYEFIRRVYCHPCSEVRIAMILGKVFLSIRADYIHCLHINSTVFHQYVASLPTDCLIHSVKIMSNRDVGLLLACARAEQGRLGRLQPETSVLSLVAIVKNSLLIQISWSRYSSDRANNETHTVGQSSDLLENCVCVF
jgi:hypothetical protein